MSCTGPPLISHYYLPVLTQTFNLEAQMCRMFSGLGFLWLGAFFNSACVSECHPKKVDVGMVSLSPLQGPAAERAPVTP